MTKEDKLTVLARIARELNDQKITWAVSASLLLYFKGIAEEFHDIDIMTTEEDAPRVKEILSGMGQLQPLHPAPQYRTRHFYEFVIDGVDVDVMAGFVIVRDEQMYDVPFTAGSVSERITVDGQSIPLQAVSEWRRLYELMGRAAKVRMIDDFYSE